MLTITVAQDGSGDFASVSEAVLPCLMPAQQRSALARAFTAKSWCAKNRISP